MSLSKKDVQLIAVMSGVFTRLRMSAAQIAVLSAIGVRSGIRFCELEHMVGISSTRLCFHLGTLIGAGDILPRPEGRGRKKKYYITPQGLNRLEKTIRITMDIVQKYDE